VPKFEGNPQMGNEVVMQPLRELLELVHAERYRPEVSMERNREFLTVFAKSLAGRVRRVTATLGLNVAERLGGCAMGFCQTKRACSAALISSRRGVV
jgi:hypothetical protein